jgi:CTP:molybdopterin cytidylyltransferase MocA
LFLRREESLLSASSPPPRGRVAGLVLGAGAGVRFGGPKALVELDGELLVDRATRLLAAADCDPVVVVAGAAADEVASRARDAEIVVNPGWATGIGSSLRAGLVELRGRADAAVIVLVDQPRLGAESVERVIAAWTRGATVAQATYGGVPGHPVLLDATVWDDVAALATGDVGARAFLTTRPDLVTLVSCDGTGDPVDVDTPEDLDRLR